MMSLRLAPTMALWNFAARRVLFLLASSSIPFLCLRRYSTVQVTFLGLRFILWEASHFLFRNRKDWEGNYEMLIKKSVNQEKKIMFRSSGELYYHLLNTNVVFKRSSPSTGRHWVNMIIKLFGFGAQPSLLGH